MSEVVDWNPVDNSNTAAPPDGWPEGQQPSSVNDCGRMMMGAIKRYQQSVTAQIGSVAGTISTTTINATTINTTGAITASGAITGSAINSTGNASVAGTLTAGAVSTGNITATGNIAANGDLIAHGNIVCDHTVFTHDVNASVSIYAANTVQGAYVHSTGNAGIDGTITAGTVNTGAINATSVSSTSNVAASSFVNTPYLTGGEGGAGTLRMYGSGNNITFRWDGGVSGGGAAAYRIDAGVVEKYMCTTVNVFDLQYAYPGGGPTSAVMGGHDVPGTWYYSFIDYLSDERIKDNIAPSEIDAITVLNQVPVSQFDVKGAVAAWMRNIGMDTAERIASMQDAAPVHVPIGFVAQRVQPHVPNAVTVARQDGAIAEAPLPVDVLNINKQEFIPYLVRAIQQLTARIEQLEAGGINV